MTTQLTQNSNPNIKQHQAPICFTHNKNPNSPRSANHYHLNRHHDHHHHHHEAPNSLTKPHQSFGMKQQHSKLLHTPSREETPTTNSQFNSRRLIKFLYLYAILIVALYASYAAYYFYSARRANSSQQPEQLAEKLIQNSVDQQSSQPPQDSQQQQQQQVAAALLVANQAQVENNKQLELKMRLLERSIELLAHDLEETRSILKEREKCDCPQSCSFNNTKYADGSTWQQQCDTCTCQAGRISCTSRKCPTLDCDEQFQPANSCCPVCLRKCKFNGTLIKHGQIVGPSSTNITGNKECRCMDGRIKCELNTNRKRAVTVAKSNIKSSQVSGDSSGAANDKSSKVIAGEMQLIVAPGKHSSNSSLEIIKEPALVADWPVEATAAAKEQQQVVDHRKRRETASSSPVFHHKHSQTDPKRERKLN